MALTIGLGYFTGQGDFVAILVQYGIFFGLYAWLCYRAADADLYYLLGLGLVLRGILVFAFPALSDDIYRFVWDGRLLTQGINPFDRLPSAYAAEGYPVVGLDASLYALLNSPDYFTIYPPVAQAVFALSCYVSPESLYGSMLVMKSCLFAFEAGTLWLMVGLLRYTGVVPRQVLWYALNPLVILEVCGNLHFEGVMVFFLLLAYWLLMEGRTIQAAPAYALSIASKLLPLMFLPLLLWRLHWRWLLMFYALTGAVCLALFAPLFNHVFLANLGNSLQLYFRQFEFNASVFYLAKWAGKALTGENPIKYVGPALGAITFTCAMLIALLGRNRTWQQLPAAMLWVFTIHLLLATTVHPWYLLLPVALSVFTRYRFALLWSGAVILSYSHYMDGVFKEKYGLIALEYLVVYGAILWELIKGRQQGGGAGQTANPASREAPLLGANEIIG